MKAPASESVAERHTSSILHRSSIDQIAAAVENRNHPLDSSAVPRLSRFVMPRCRSISNVGYGKCLRTQCTQLEFVMDGDERCLHVLLRDHERYIAFRRSLRDRDNIHVL